MTQLNEIILFSRSVSFRNIQNHFEYGGWVTEWLACRPFNPRRAGWQVRISIAVRSRNPPYYRGFGELETSNSLYGCAYRIVNKRGIWAEIGHGADPPENADNYFCY